jgi:hypothetical protein
MIARGGRFFARLVIVLVLSAGLPVAVGGCYGSGVTTGVYVGGGYGGYGPYGGYRGPYGYPAAYPGRYPGYGGGVVITGYP